MNDHNLVIDRTKESLIIKAYYPYAYLNYEHIIYGTKDQYVHINGTTHDLFKFKGKEGINLMIAQRLHPPQINKEMQTWLLCSRRMGIHKDIRLLICN